MKTTHYPTRKAAQRAILADLGHALTGTIQAGLAARLIESDEDEARTAEVFRHPELPDREYLVDWAAGCTFRD